MYKAKVEAISGIKVLAGGKWLQCIGNKNFHVGELIWTDGRCAYGNHYTPQQPLIITAPKVDDEGIPILMYNFILNKLGIIYQDFNNMKTSYYTFNLKQGLKQVEGEKKLLLEADIPQGSGTNTGMRKEQVFLINSKQAPAFINPSEWKYEQAYGSYEYGTAPQRWTFPIAFNIGHEGNIYELRAVETEEWVDWAPFSYDGEGWLTHTKVQLIKNNEILQEFKFSEILTEAMATARNIAWSSVSHPTSVFCDYPSSSTFWGAIEHDTDWAFIVKIKGSAAAKDKNEGKPWSLVEQAYASCYAMYLYTPDGVMKFAYITTKSVATDNYYTPRALEKDDDATNLSLPIQDGYYCKINELIRPTELSSFPSTANITICSPDDTELFTGTCVFGTYFTICKIAEGKYLLGADSRDTDTNANNLDIYSGLYLIKDKQLKKIADGHVRNWKLRPMKNAKGWQNRIEALGI